MKVRKPRQPIRRSAPGSDHNHHDGDVHHDDRDCHHDIGDDNHDDKKEKTFFWGRTPTHPPYKMPELVIMIIMAMRKANNSDHMINDDVVGDIDEKDR